MTPAHCIGYPPDSTDLPFYCPAVTLRQVLVPVRYGKGTARVKGTSTADSSTGLEPEYSARTSAVLARLTSSFNFLLDVYDVKVVERSHLCVALQSRFESEVSISSKVWAL